MTIDIPESKIARLCLEWNRTDPKNAGDQGFHLACAVTSVLYELGLVSGGQLTPNGRRLAVIAEGAQ